MPQRTLVRSSAAALAALALPLAGAPLAGAAPTAHPGSTLASTARANTTPASAAPADADRADADRAPKGIVDLRDVAPTVLHDIRYATKHNFVGARVDGYPQARCLLSRPAAEQLAAVQRDVRKQGYSLKVYDCYRPQRAVDHFVRWAADEDDEAMKREFYPRIDKSTLFEDGYIAEKSGHSRASTVDLTLVRLPAEKQKKWTPADGLQPCYWPRWARFTDTSIDMGTGYDCFDTRSHTEDPRSTPTQQANRQRLVTAMEDRGFSNYANEWWHFTLEDEPYPDRYFDFPVSRSSLTG